jgi:hypothetical protein
MNVARVRPNLDRSDASRKDRRRSRGELGNWQQRRAAARRGVAAVAAPEASRPDAEEDRLTGRLSGCWEQQANRGDWVVEHPEAARHLDDLTTGIEALDERLQRSCGVPERVLGLDPTPLGLARRWRGSAIRH